MLLQRVGNGADAMSAREVLEIATRGGAAVLGRGAELGSIEAGKRADLAIWDVSGLEAAGAWDPVAALVLCGPFAVRDLLVEGRRSCARGGCRGARSRRWWKRRAARLRAADGMKVFVLTGAGVSAESGLGTFRDKGGIWAEFDPMELATPEAFARDPGAVHAFYNMRRRNLLAAAPNAAHVALARLEAGLAARGGAVSLHAEYRRPARAGGEPGGASHAR